MAYVPSQEHIDRTVEIERAYTLSRVKVLERLPGNPVGVAYRSFGPSALALRARYLPVPAFNTVYGLKAGDDAVLPEIDAWYRASGAQARFELVPGRSDEALARALARLGYVQSGFHASAIALPPFSAAPAADGVTVETVEDEARFATFLDTYCAGWGIPDRAGFAASVGGWLREPGWTLYLASHQGRPGAVAILYLGAGAAYLADGAADPALRERGLHAALIARRLSDAFAAGAQFACSGAAFLSTSHRNMARAGMSLQFVRAVWTAAEPTDPR